MDTSCKSTASAGDKPGQLDDSLTDIQWLKVVKPLESQCKGLEEALSQRTLKRGTRESSHETDLDAPPNTEETAEEGKCAKDDGQTQRPPYSYASLIALAIQSTPEKRMTLTQLYEWFETHFPYYRTAKKGWKNSVRHNLSLCSFFVRIPNGTSKGSFWALRPGISARQVYHSRTHRTHNHLEPRFSGITGRKRASPAPRAQPRFAPILPRMPASQSMFIGPLPSDLVYALACYGMLPRPLSQLLAIPASAVLQQPTNCPVVTSAPGDNSSNLTNIPQQTQAGATSSTGAVLSGCDRQQPVAEIDKSEASASMFSPLTSAPVNMKAISLSQFVAFNDGAQQFSCQPTETEAQTAPDSGFEGELLQHYSQEGTGLDKVPDVHMGCTTPTRLPQDNLMNFFPSPLFSMDNANDSFASLKRDLENGFFSPLKNLENLLPSGQLDISLGAGDPLSQIIADAAGKMSPWDYLAAYRTPLQRKTVNAIGRSDALASTPERPHEARRINMPGLTGEEFSHLTPIKPANSLHSHLDRNA